MAISGVSDLPSHTFLFRAHHVTQMTAAIFTKILKSHLRGKSIRVPNVSYVRWGY